VIIDKQGEIAGMFNAVSTNDSKKGIEVIKRALAEEYVPEQEKTPPSPVTEVKQEEDVSTPNGAK
jgi:hypothetical protein